MTTDRADRLHRIVGVLAGEIARAPEGVRLPSEQRLMERFGVGRSLIRAVLADLERQHLIRRESGVGTFTHHRVDYPSSTLRRPSYHDILQRAGLDVEVITLEYTTAPAIGSTAFALDVETDTMVPRIVRLGHIDGHPATSFDEWFAPGLITELSVAMSAFGSIMALFAGLGFDPVRSATRGTIDAVPNEIAARLHLPEHSDAWFVESLTRDRATGRPLLVSRAWTRTDLVRMVFETGTTAADESWLRHRTNEPGRDHEDDV